MNSEPLIESASADYFDFKNTDAKLIKRRLIRMLVLATNKHKLDYASLKYIHNEVIKRARLSKPKANKKLYHLPTDEDIEAFFEAVTDPQVKLLFTFIHNSGLRVAEVCKLKVSDIDFKNQTMLITGKGNKDRIVPLTSKIIERIQLYLHGKKLKYLFETRLGTSYTTRRVEQLCSEIKDKAKISKKLTPHTFRHFYLTKLAEQGVSPDIRAMLAGHSNLETQEIYTHLALGGTKSLILGVLEKMEREKILK